MCLTVRFKSRTDYYEGRNGEAARRVKKLAEEDIPVIKILKKEKGRYFTPFQGFEIELNKLYTSKFSYDSCVADDDEDENSFENFLRIESGLHSCKNRKRAEKYMFYSCTGQLYDAIIPKGSLYFEADDLLCSNQLIILGRNIKNKKKS